MGKAKEGVWERYNVELCGINTDIKNHCIAEHGQKALTVKPYSCWLSLHCKYLIIQLINPNIVSIRNNRPQWPCIDNFKPFQSYEFSDHGEMIKAIEPHMTAHTLPLLFQEMQNIFDDLPIFRRKRDWIWNLKLWVFFYQPPTEHTTWLIYLSSLNTSWLQVKLLQLSNVQQCMEFRLKLSRM